MLAAVAAAKKAARSEHDITQKLINEFSKNHERVQQLSLRLKELKRDVKAVNADTAEKVELGHIAIFRLCNIIGACSPDERKEVADRLELPSGSEVAGLLKQETTIEGKWKALYEHTSKTAKYKHAHYAVIQLGCSSPCLLGALSSLPGSHPCEGALACC